MDLNERSNIIKEGNRKSKARYEALVRYDYISIAITAALIVGWVAILWYK